MSEALERAVLGLQQEVQRLKKTVARLERVEPVGGGPISDANVSNPPTDAQMDAVFGAPATISQGMIKFVDDNGAATAVYLVVPVNGAWWAFTGTKLV